MAEILELERIEIEPKQELPKPAKDTWILKLPAEICRQEGYSEDTMISLTVKNGGVQTEVIHRTPKAKESARKFVEKYGDFMKEMERAGD